MGKENSNENTPKNTARSFIQKIPHKGFIALCLLIVLVPFISKAVKNYTHYLKEKDQVIVIEGESPLASNFHDSTGYIGEKNHFFGGKSLQLNTRVAVDGGYWVTYEVEISEESPYSIYLVGTPPGPARIGSEWHSPYSISIDGGPERFLVEEIIRTEWPFVFSYRSSSGGYYFTKIATAQLSQGKHTITIRINDRRQKDDHFTIYLDALLLAPSSFQPKANIGKIPKELFYE